MEKISIIALLVGISGLATVANATTTTTTVSGQNYASLVPANAGYSHAFEYGNDYEWGINLASGTQLATASLTIVATLENVSSGTLYASLLDLPAVSGITQTAYTGETQNGPDYFAGKAGFVGDTSKIFSEYSKTTLTFNLALVPSELSALNTYLAGQTGTEGFDFGFDPHCTYVISSLCFNYTTVKSNGSGSVPDVSVTAFLLAFGLFSVECCRRKFAFSK
jgi:hypothetical protein